MRLVISAICSIMMLSTIHAGSSLAAEDASRSGGEVFKELPTLHCLGVRWKIMGDSNKDAVIHVAYRTKGKKWQSAMPLFRTIPSPDSSNKSSLHTVKGGWMFAGSIFDLKPDTDYEVKLNLEDPDGGEEEKLLSMKTWKEPLEPQKGMVHKFVVPGTGANGGDGSMKKPYRGINAALAQLQPGTVFLLAPGTYPSFIVTKNGTEKKPIIFRGSGKGDVIIDGAGKSAVKIGGRKHIWFENMHIHNAMYGINGNKSSNIVIRGCTFRKVTKGFNAEKGDYNTSQHHFIVDNDYIGSSHWPRTKGIESVCFVQATGGGHVIAYNRMYNTGDGVHGKSSGNWSACDIYANDFNICTDDGAETDYTDFNLRVWGNVFRNVAHAVTAQPSHGGPTYIFRNVIYNVLYSPFKLHNHTSGVLIFHNTVLAHKNGFSIVPANETVTNVYTRNNLFISQKGTGLYVGTSRVGTSDFDNDGYGGFDSFAVWNRSHKYATMVDAKKGQKIYYHKGAYKINPATCFANALKAPDNIDRVYEIADMDCRLNKESDAIDKGVRLLGINDAFTGKAPDLGAIEFGDTMPQVGPRR